MSRKNRKVKGFKFQPFSIKQKKLLFFWEKGSPFADKDIVIADGAIRSGKTIAMICSFFRWSLKHFKGENFILAGKTIGALKKNVIGPMQQILKALGLEYTYNRSENFIVIGDNTYYMYDASTEASQDKLQGLTAAGALADEVALFPQSFVDQMIGRCSVDGAKIFMNCNPGSPYHFVKTELIDKSKEKNILYMHFTMDDNLSLSERVKERFRRMFSGVFFKRYILGLWVQAEGLIYDMFDEVKHKVQTIIREYKEFYISCDYGTQNATVFLLWGKYFDLQIRIDQKQILSKQFFIIPESLTKYEVDLTHSHSIPNGSTGTALGKLVIREGLKIGDKVLLLRVQGGQQYVVLDRVV